MENLNQIIVIIISILLAHYFIKWEARFQVFEKIRVWYYHRKNKRRTPDEIQRQTLK